MYRLRKLFQELLEEGELLTGCVLEYWQNKNDIHLKVYTAGVIRSELKTQLPELVQDFLVYRSLGRKDEWNIKDSKIGAGYVLIVFGNVQERTVFGLEEFKDED